MAFPVRTMTRSALLDGQSNGRLDGDILETTPGQAGGATVVLVKPAARAWRALCAAAKRAGHTLKATSVADGYRLYEIQERIFRDRYTTTYLAGRPYKIWNGVRWYQRPGTAIAAVPGTSNHGWASAVDTGEERDSDAGAESLDDPTLAWLLANEQTYGWSHELQSEPWHLRYFAGDAIPKAVLAYEAGATAPAQEDLMLRIATVKGEPTAAGDQPNVAAKYRVLSAIDKGGKPFDVEAWHLTGGEYDVWRFAGLDEDATAIAASTWHTLGIPVHGGPFAQAGR